MIIHVQFMLDSNSTSIVSKIHILHFDQSPIQSCRSLQALYLCKRLKSSPKTRDHVTNDHVTIFYQNGRRTIVDIQKLAFDNPSTRCSCHDL